MKDLYFVKVSVSNFLRNINNTIIRAVKTERLNYSDAATIHLEAKHKISIKTCVIRDSV